MDIADTERAEQFRSDLLTWSEENLRLFPWRDPDATPYEVLVAEMFLKQTRSTTVASVLPEFLEQFPSPASLEGADQEEIIDIIRPLGIYHHRSRALQHLGEQLGASTIPETEEELQELPQVGRYVANATLCFGFDRPRPILDSNIRRIYTRLFPDIAHLSNDDLWDLAAAMLPEEDVKQYNMALLDFGAELCTDTSPACEKCFATSCCDYYQQQSGQDED